MKQIRNFSNPQEAVQNLAQQNSSIQSILALQQRNGVSLQQIAQIMAQQKGINLEDLMQQLQSE